MDTTQGNEPLERSTGLRVLRTIAAAVFAISLILGVAPQAEAGDGERKPGNGRETILVSGDAVPSDCNDGVGMGALAMTGDMEGCLIFLTLEGECEELNGFARYQEKGTESWAGTILGDEGTFKTRYTLEATYTQGSCELIDSALAGEGAFPFDRQLTGGCDHKIIGQSGAFKKATGLVVFHDVIPNPGVSGASNFFWSADVRILRKK